MEHSKIDPKHIAEPETSYQAFMTRMLHRILELSTLELVVATLHLALTAAAVFGLLGAAEGGH